MILRSLGVLAVGAMSLLGCIDKPPPPPPPPPPSHVQISVNRERGVYNGTALEMWAHRRVFIPTRSMGQNNCKIFPVPPDFGDVDFHVDGACTEEAGPTDTMPIGRWWRQQQYAVHADTLTQCPEQGDVSPVRVCYADASGNPVAGKFAPFKCVQDSTGPKGCVRCVTDFKCHSAGSSPQRGSKSLYFPQVSQ